MKPRLILTISYQVFDEHHKFVGVIKESGYNKNNIDWKAERKAKHIYGRKSSIKPIKIIKEN